MTRTARTVVGPDEPRDDAARVEVESDHWASLRRTLRRAGVEIGVADLRALRHDVEISQRLRGRLRAPGPGSSRA